VLALAVCASIIGLALGAMSYVVGRGRGSAALDGLILGAIPLVIALQVVPHVYESVGRWAFVFVAAGFAVLTVADRVGHSVGERAGRAVLLPTMLVHALADGATLAIASKAASGAMAGESVANAALIGAVLAHRIPEGVLLTSAFYKAMGLRSTVLRLLMVAAATVVGALLGGALLRVVADAWLDAVVAFGVGAMLRFALHTHDELPASQRAKSSAGVAFILGISVILWIPNPHSVLRQAQPMELSIARSFLPLLIETAPALAVTLVCVALLLPRQASTALDLSPTRIRLQRWAAQTFAPEWVLLSLGWFGLRFALLTVAIGGALSALIALAASSAGVTQTQPKVESWTVLDALAGTLGWSLVGLVLASVIEASLVPDFCIAIKGGRALIVLGMLGVLIAHRWPVLIAVTAVLLHKSMDATVALSLLGGAMIGQQIRSEFGRELPSLGALMSAGNRVRFALVAAAVSSVSLLAVICGVLAKREDLARQILSLHAMVFHDHSALEWLATMAVLSAATVTIVLLGPRHWWAAMQRRAESLARNGTAHR
jgi:hypothetical protein